tara:strand:+ start:431 stop:745 length:315 start_codon:yes stop_codon:yes gene_type:complete
MISTEKNTSAYVVHEEAVYFTANRKTIRGIWTTREAAEKYVANAQRYLKRKLSEGVKTPYSSLEFSISEYKLNQRDASFFNRVGLGGIPPWLWFENEDDEDDTE